MTQDEKIQYVLDKMHALFAQSVGPNNRNDYMAEHQLHGINWHFTLSADDIVNQKIPANVAGCTGRARVFFKFASEIGLECFVVATAKQDELEISRQLRKNQQPDRGIRNGHQVIAMRDEITGKLRAFDPGGKNLRYFNSEINVGGILKFRPNPGDVPVDYVITAIVSPQEFDKVASHRDIHNLYMNGTVE